MKIDLIAMGTLKKGPLFELCADYQKRIKWSLNITEFESKHKDAARVQLDEQAAILANLNRNAIVIAMDERGNGLRSLDFSNTIQNFQNTGESHLQFVIGGADGLTDEIRKRANILLSFGQQTWPHMMARAMLLEQIYRAQQILAHHPYHRE